MSKVLETFIETRLIDYTIEESSEGVTIIKGKYQQADEVNDNQRDYAQPVWDHIFKESDTPQRIKKRAMIGELEHPDDGQTKLFRGSHVVTNLWQDEGTKAILGASEVIPTPNGLILEVYVLRRVLFGVSSRGKGTSTRRNGIEYVDPGFFLETFDFVYNPSTKGAYPTGFQMPSESKIQIPPDFDTSQYNTKCEDLYYVNSLVPLAIEASSVVSGVTTGILTEKKATKKILEIEKKTRLIEGKDSELVKICNSIFDLITEARTKMGANTKETVSTTVIPDEILESLGATYIKGLEKGIKLKTEMTAPVANPKSEEEPEEPETEPKTEKKSKKKRESAQTKELDSLPEMDMKNDDDLSKMNMGTEQSHGNGKLPKPSGKVNNEGNYAAKHHEMNGKSTYGEMGGYEPDMEDDEYGDDELGPDATHGEMGGSYNQEDEEEPGSLGVSPNQPKAKRDPVLSMALTGESVSGHKVESLSKNGLLKLVEQLALGYESQRQLSEALLVKCTSLKKSNSSLQMHYESSLGLLSGVVERVEAEKKKSVIEEAIKADPSIAYLRPALEACNNVNAIQECITESKKIQKEEALKKKITESQKTKKEKKRKKKKSGFDESISQNKKKIAKQKKKPADFTKKTESKEDLGKKAQMSLMESITNQQGWK